MPETGSYGCVDLPGPFGWAIREFTHSHYCHAFMVLDGTPGCEIILEAAPTGSRITNLAKYHSFDMKFSKDRIAAPSDVLMRVAVDHYSEIPYGFDDIALLGMVTTV